MDTSIEVRCNRCAGSGANVINAPKPNTTTALTDLSRRPDEVREAA
jgi:hypothetical protein